MLPCHPERAFYYWRHGLWGHVVKVCEVGSENKSASIFLYLYCGLAHAKLGETEAALTYLSRFRHRTDLSLVYHVTRYVVGRSLPSPDGDYLEEVRADALATVANSNTLSLYYGAMVARLFGERAIVREVLWDAPDNWMLSLLRGWIDLCGGRPERALARFRGVLEERARSFEKMQSDFLKRRERLHAKHDEQLRVFVDHAESGRRRLIKNRNHLIEGHIKRLSLIDQEFANPDELNGELSEERRQVLEEVEAAYPIPRMRSASFTTVRQRIRTQSAESEAEARLGSGAGTEADTQPDEAAAVRHAVEEGVTEVLSVGERNQDEQEEAAITFQ
jgi:hypothetical protein